MKVSTGAKWGKSKVPKLRQISTGASSNNAPATARDYGQRNRVQYDDVKRSGSLSARESFAYQKSTSNANKTKRIIKNVNTRTALAAKIKALSQLDLNSNSDSSSNKPSTPKQQIPTFRRAYKLSKENGNVKRNSRPEINDTSSDEDDAEDPATEDVTGRKGPFQDVAPPPGMGVNKNISRDKSQMQKWKKQNLTQHHGKGQPIVSKKSSEVRQERTTFSAPVHSNQSMENNVTYQKKIVAAKSKMESEVHIKETKIKNLKKRLESNDLVLQAKLKQISNLEKENRSMKEKLGTVDKNHKVSLKQKVNEVMSLKRVIAAFNVEKNATTKEKMTIAKVESECQALRAQVTKLAADLHEKNELLNDSNKKANTERLNKNIKGLQGERESLITQINAMKGALGVQKLRIGELEERLKIEVRNHTKDNAEEQAKIRELQNKYNDLYKKWQAQKSVQTNQFKLQDEKEKEMLNEQITKLKKEIEKLKKNVSKEKSKNSKISNQLKAEQNVIKDLREKLNCIDTLNSKINEITSLYTREQQTNEALQRKLREKEANFAVEIKSLTEKYEAELVAERNKYLSLQKDMEKLQKEKENENQAITMDHLRTIESLKDQLQKLQKTNEKVLYDIAEIKQQKDMLNKRCNSQQMTIANQSAEIGKYQVQVKDANQENAKLACKVKRLEGQKIELENELKDLKNKFDDLKHEHTKLTVQFEAGQDSIKRQANEIDALKAEVRKLQSEVSGNSHAHSELAAGKEQLAAELEVANEKISELVLQRKKLEEKLDSANEKMKEICDDSNSSSKHLSAVENKLKDLQNAMKDVQNQLDSMTAKYKKAQQLGKNAIKEAVGYKSDLKSITDKLKAKDDLIAQIQKELEKARQSNEEKDHKIKKLEAALNELRKVLKSKANISQALEKSTEAVKEKEKEVEKCLLQIKRLKRDLKSQGNDLNKLKSKEADAEDVATELENMKRKLALIESNSKSKSKEIKSLKAKLANLQDIKEKQDDATALKAEVEALKTKLEQKTKDAKSSQKIAKDHVSRLQDMRKKMKTLEAKDKEMGDLLQARDEHIVKCRDQIQRLKRVVNAAENSAQKKRIEAEKNNQFSEEKMTQLSQLLKELDSSIAAEQKGKGYISNVNVLIKTGETSTYKKKAETSLKKVSNLEQRISVLLYNVKYCEKQIAKYDEKIARKQIAARKEALDKLEKKFQEEEKKAKRFNETSKDNIDELKALLPGAKEKLSAATKSRKTLVEKILSLVK